MHTQTKYNEIIKELQDMPVEDMPKFLEIVNYLKTGMKESRKKEKIKKGKRPSFWFSWTYPRERRKDKANLMSKEGIICRQVP